LASLNRSVVRLDILRPGGETVTAAGFFVEGVTGLVTSHRLIKGAESVTARAADGTSQAIREFIARDPRSDLIVLRISAGPALRRGNPQMLARGQGAFSITPPGHAQPHERLGFWRIFQAASAGDMLAIKRLTSTLGPDLIGAPVVDSLGGVVGVFEMLTEGATDAYFAISIDRVIDLMAKTDVGGSIGALAADPIANWATPGKAARWQVVGTTFAPSTDAKDRETALAFLQRAYGTDARQIETLIELGMAYQVQNQHPKAEEYYRQALKLDDRNAITHLYLGSCLFMQGMYLQAQFEYEAAIDARPAWAMPHVNMAGVYVQQGKTDRAEESLRRALQLDPGLGVAKANLGVILFSAGRQNETLSLLRELETQKSGYATLLRRQMTPKAGN
jgi:Flp pilus assembly protein TadD